LEQAVQEAVPAPTHFDHNLLAFVDSYAYDDHEQVAADRTRLTAEQQAELKNKSAALGQLSAKLMDLHTAVKLL